jgi:hypothetical protein
LLLLLLLQVLMVVRCLVRCPQQQVQGCCSCCHPARCLQV